MITLRSERVKRLGGNLFCFSARNSCQVANIVPRAFAGLVVGGKNERPWERGCLVVSKPPYSPRSEFMYVTIVIQCHLSSDLPVNVQCSGNCFPRSFAAGRRNKST